MAAIVLRLRRAAAASISYSGLSHRTPPLIRALTAAPAITGNPTPTPVAPYSLIKSQSFRSSPPSQLARRPDASGEHDIDPNEILFEGCDYNHWLITMDFPRDPAPSPEEMVETYVQTLAKVVGSVEEAKKRMYACSTTTYQGFQAVMTEEMSEKFNGLPGVVFILPDSYIDPVNKQYGGDKYDNGVITPRPPPTQYRQQGRYNTQNRSYNQPRYGSQREPMPAEQGYRPRDRQPPMQGDDRNYGPPQQNFGPPQQNYSPPQQNFGPPQQNYGPPQQNFGPPQQNYSPPQQNFGPSQQNYSPPQQNFVPPQQNFVPPQQHRGPPQQNFGLPQQNHSPPQQHRGPPQQSYGPPQQGYGLSGQDRNVYGPPGCKDSPPSGEGRDFVQGGGRDLNQRQGVNYAPQEQRNFAQGHIGDNSYPGPSRSGSHDQGSTPGSYGEHRQGSASSCTGDNRQGVGSGHGGEY